jgi:vacuolar protein-sorting-associated protein 4
MAAMTEGYSGADISVIVRDAMMQPIRIVQSATHFRLRSGPSPTDPTVTVSDLYEPCSDRKPGAIKMTWVDVPGDKLLPPLAKKKDFLKSIQTTRPSVNHEDVEKQMAWSSEFGMDG